MGKAGESYRLVLGWLFLTMDVVLFIGGHVLLYKRRNYYPLKAWNPVLMAAVLYCIVPGALWVPVREIAGDDLFRASDVLWLITTSVMIYGASVNCIMYRLWLICELEQNKVNYAKAIRVLVGPTASLVISVPTVGSTAEHKHMNEGERPSAAVLTPKLINAWRLGAFTLAAMVPSATVTGIFLLTDRSADWSNHHFSYWNLSVIPLAFLFLFGPLVALRTGLALRSYNADAWGIAVSLGRASRYAQILRVAWIVLNCVVPEFNNLYIDSGYLVNISIRFVIIQLVIVPALRTYQVVQRHPVATVRTKVVPIRIHVAGSITSVGSGSRPNSANGVFRPVSSVALYMNAKNLSLADHPLMKVLTTKEYYDKFLVYAESEFASENVLFWEAVNHYRGSSPTIQAANEVYQRFFDPESPLQVNLSSVNTDAVRRSLAAYAAGKRKPIARVVPLPHRQQRPRLASHLPQRVGASISFGGSGASLAAAGNAECAPRPLRAANDTIILQQTRPVPVSAC